MNFDFNFGEMTYYEREKLYNYIKLFNPNIILDCGSGKGGSTYVMLNAINNKTKIYSCDPFRNPDFESEKIEFFLLKSLSDFKNLENYVKIGALHIFKTIYKFSRIMNSFRRNKW